MADLPTSTPVRPKTWWLVDRRTHGVQAGPFLIEAECDTALERILALVSQGVEIFDPRYEHLWAAPEYRGLSTKEARKLWDSKQ